MLVGNDLYEFAKKVNSRKDFIEFTASLAEHYRVKRDEWENIEMESFLQGLSGFSQDMDGYYKNMGEVVNVDVITWRMAAQMLLAATVYNA